MLARSSRRGGAARATPVHLSPVTHDLDRIVAAERPTQRRVELRSVLPDDEEQSSDQMAILYRRLERADGNQRSSGESSQRIVSSRWAPVEMRQKGTPTSSSSRSM